MSDLTILTVIEGDPGLFEIMVSSVLKHTSPPPKFIVCDNSGGKHAARIEKLKGIADIDVLNNKPDLVGGSNRHGDGINKIFAMANTRYVAIVESDVAVLDSDWWKIDPSRAMKAAIKKDGLDLYHVCFIIFDTQQIDKSKIDLRPGKSDKDRAGRTSYTVDEDVGWKIKKVVNSSMVDRMKFVECRHGGGQLFEQSDEVQCDEFHDAQGILIATHLGRGSNMRGKTQKTHLPIKDQLELWVKKVQERIQLK